MPLMKTMTWAGSRRTTTRRRRRVRRQREKKTRGRNAALPVLEPVRPRQSLPQRSLKVKIPR